MRYKKLLLPIMALMLSCNFITGLGSGASGSENVDYDAPADPLNVTVALNEDETTSAVISPEGGELTLVGADGSVYTLEVPAGALAVETEISMTTIDTLEGGPVESNVYGVQLEPSGLAFNELLTLTIQPASDIPLEEQFMFKYEGNGEDFHHAMVDSDSNEIKISMLDFSGGGVGKSFRDNSYTYEMGKAQSTGVRLENQLGKTLQEARKGKLSKEQRQAKIDKILEKYRTDVVEVAMDAAKGDCKYLGKALESQKKLDSLRKQFDEDSLQSFKEIDLSAVEYKCLIFSAKMQGGPLKSDAIRIAGTFSLEGTADKCSHFMTFYPSSSTSPFSGTTSLESDCGEFTASGTGDYTITLTETGGVIKGKTGWLTTVQSDAKEQTPFTVILTRIAP